MRHFNKDIQGRRLCIFTDHRPLIGSFASPDLQAHDPQALNAINEISQFTSDIRHKPGIEIPVADWLSRQPIDIESDKNKNKPAVSGGPEPPPFVSQTLSFAALEEVGLQTLNPTEIAKEQEIGTEKEERRSQSPRSDDEIG